MRKLICLATSMLFLLCNSTFAQNRVITGKVTDVNGTPLSGATVKLKNSRSGTSANTDGSFTINASENSVLVVSAVGYETKELNTGTQTNLTIPLFLDTRPMSEVVVTGYGESLKKDLTSSVSRVKGSETANMPVPNFAQAIQGRVSGVQIESQSGRLGEGIKILVRGAGSINASNQPLIVIDGLPVNTGTLTGNALADINFDDVETFDVLKDAAATAIYGSRASNGVIIITTKKGRAGRAKFNVNVQYGTNRPTNLRGFLNAAEYIEFMTEAAVNAGKYHFNRAGNWMGFVDEQEAIDYHVDIVEGRFTRYSGANDDWRTLKNDVNWEKLAFNYDANSKSADVSASGGSDKTKYFISGSYDDQDGILVGNNFKRITGRINLDQELTTKFKIGVNLSIGRTEASRIADDNDFSTPLQLVAMAPITPPRDPDGVLYDRPVTTYYNGLIELENAEYSSITFRNIATVFGNYEFSKNLLFRTEFGTDILTQDDEAFYGSRTINGGGSSNGYARSDWLRTVRYVSNNYFNYKNEFGGKHSIDATVGMAYENAKTNSNFVTGEQFPSDDLRTLASAGTITGGESKETELGIVSYFGRVNYKLLEKYLLGVSARYDGSSVFGSSKRYGFFPAVSAGWILSEENFLKNSNFVNFLKLRGSYGLLGNSQGFGEYGAQGSYTVGKYAGSSTLYPGRLANDLLTWETTRQFDLGVEMGILKNRINLEIDYYKRRSLGDEKGAIFNFPVPLTSGYASILKNGAIVQNNGVDISINSINFNGKDFKWTTNFNISFNKNEVVRLDGQVDTISFLDGRYMNSLIVGQSIGAHYGPRYAGVDPANGDALYYLIDGKSTTDDYNAAGFFVVGDPNPDWFGGITNTFSYKGIELSVLFQGVFGNDIVNGGGGFMSARGDWFDNQTRDQLKRWQNPGDVTNVPQARWNWLGDYPTPGVSTQYMESGSYVRLKDITLSYKFPSDWMRRMKIESAKLYVSGINLATFTNYSGWDPEVNADYRSTNVSQGGDFYSAPQIKSVVVGLNIGF